MDLTDDADGFQPCWGCADDVARDQMDSLWWFNAKTHDKKKWYLKIFWDAIVAIQRMMQGWNCGPLKLTCSISNCSVSWVCTWKWTEIQLRYPYCPVKNMFSEPRQYLTVRHLRITDWYFFSPIHSFFEPLNLVFLLSQRSTVTDNQLPIISPKHESGYEVSVRASSKQLFQCEKG